MFCTNCGSQIDDKAVICPHCGVPTTGSPFGQKNTHKANDSFSFAGFILGIFSLFFGFLCVLPALGLSFSILGLFRSRAQGGINALGTAGVIINSILLALWVFFWTIILIVAL